MPNIYREAGVCYAFTQPDEPSFKKFKGGPYEVWCKTETDFKELLKYWSRTKYWKYKPFYKKEKAMPEYKFTEKWKEGISVKDLEEAGACTSELHRFAFHVMEHGCHGFRHKLNLDFTMQCAAKCDGGLAWLLDRGFIEVVKPEVLYSMGQKFHYIPTNEYYILSCIGYQRQAILINMMFGTRAQDPFEVQDMEKITRKEFEKIAGSSYRDFKLVKRLVFTRDIQKGVEDIGWTKNLI